MMDIEQIKRDALAAGIERRAFTVDRLAIERRAEGETPHIVGHAAVFNTTIDIGRWFRERIAPGAFKRAVAEDDVRALFNHDENWILGRTKAQTLSLSEDDKGLAVDVLPPDTQLVRDLVLTPIERGDVSQMSFAFRVRKEEWDETGDVPLRTLLEVELFDVSPVTFPAYPTTDVGLRSLEEFRKRRPKGLTTQNAAAIVRRSAIQRIRNKQASQVAR
jgi:HK97 family phage prohead protease